MNPEQENKIETEPERIIDISKYLPLFFDEVHENILSMEQTTLQIDQALKNRLEIDFKDLIDELFRRAHLIKSEAGTMGFSSLTEISHSMESLMDRIRRSEITLNLEISGVLIQAIDKMQSTLFALKEDHTHEPSLNGFLKVFDPWLQEQKNISYSSELSISKEEYLEIKNQENSPDFICLLKANLKPEEKIKGLRAFLALTQFSSIAKIYKIAPEMESLPELNDLKHLELYFSSGQKLEDCLNFLKNQDLLVQEYILIDEVYFESQAALQTQFSKSNLDSSQTNTMRVDIDRLNKLLNLSGELLINKAHFHQIEMNLKEVLGRKSLFSKMQSLKITLDQFEKNFLEKKSSENLTFLFKQMKSDFQEISSEVQKQTYLKNSMGSFSQAVHQFELVSTNIQKAVMDIRMVPIKPLFARLKRVVRDLSEDLKKEIHFEFFGEETELDKKMVDDLFDPLTHLIRNAADHGLEESAIRIQKGKSATGTITIKAFHKGHQVCISVSDDGIGMSREKILKKAIQKKLIEHDSAEKLLEKDAFQFIFLAGFSTAEKISQISGRGVGMDIVKTKIEDMKGKIEIQSTVGVGTTFTISLPLTLAIQKSLLIKIHENTFALPLESVKEICQVSLNQIKTIGAQKVIRVREKVIAVKRLDEIFENFLNLPENSDFENQVINVVIISWREQLIGIFVHQLLGEQDIVIKSLGLNFKTVPGISGVSILGSGKLALILDTHYIFEKFKIQSEGLAA